MVEIQIPAAQANTLLNANFTTYVHEATNTTHVRTLAYSLPDDVSNHVAFIYPTTQFIPPANNKVQVKAIQPPAAVSKRSRSRRADIPAECAQVITPACLQAIYNIPATPATDHAAASQVTQQMQQQQAQMNPMAGAGQDPDKQFKAEAENLAVVEHYSVLDDVETRLLQRVAA